MATSIIEAGILEAKNGHGRTLKAREDRLASEAAAKEEAARQKELMREQRRKDREERAKKEAKAALRAQINKHIIDKGEPKTGVANEPLLDIYGNYERTSANKFLAGIGGQLQQLYYVIEAMYEIYPESDLNEHFVKKREDPKAEAVSKANTPRELLMEQFFVPFMLGFLKELKCDFIQFMIPPKLQQIIDTLKVNRNPQTDALDFTRLNDKDYYAFRHAFVEQKLFYETYQNNKNEHAIEAILNVICMVICGRVPKNTVPFMCNQLISKIKLV